MVRCAYSMHVQAQASNTGGVNAGEAYGCAKRLSCLQLRLDNFALFLFTASNLIQTSKKRLKQFQVCAVGSQTSKEVDSYSFRSPALCQWTSKIIKEQRSKKGRGF